MLLFLLDLSFESLRRSELGRRAVFRRDPRAVISDWRQVSEELGTANTELRHNGVPDLVLYGQGRTHCYLLRLQPELELGSKETAQSASGAYYFTGAAAPQALASVSGGMK